MVTVPVTHDRNVTAGELRNLFLDEHIHMALLVDGHRLVAAVERGDLDPALPDDAPACGAGALHGRTVRPEADLGALLESMRTTGRRRYAVTDEGGTLRGLLCLKASSRGFCSDDDVASRRLGRPST